VPVTAVCWVLLMVGTMITHLHHGGFSKFVLLNLIYLVLAAFIASAPSPSPPDGRLRVPTSRLWSDLSNACHNDRSRGVLRPNP